MPHGPIMGATPMPLAYTPSSGMHVVPSQTPFPPPSTSYSAVVDAPAKGRGALVAILAVVGLALGAGVVTWYFLAGPGKKPSAIAATAADAGAPVAVVKPDPVASIDAGVAASIVVEPLPENDQAKPVIVLVDSVPRGAIIKLDGKKIGDTPFNVTIAAGRETRLVLERRGYRDEELVIDGTELKVTKKLEEIKKGHGTGSGSGSGSGNKPPPGDGHKPPPDDGHKPPPDDGDKPPPDDGDDSDILE
jgi:hypothetical protein